MDGVFFERGVEGTFGSDDALFEAKEDVEVGVPGRADDGVHGAKIRMAALFAETGAISRRQIRRFFFNLWGIINLIKMKKPLLLVIVIFLSGIEAFSQRNDWLSLSIGGSFPVGEFASKDANDSHSGAADPGGLIDLSYLHPLGKGGFGLTAALRGRLNLIDQSATAAALASSDEGYQWSGKKAYWKTAALMVGAYYHVSVAKRWQVTGSILLGAADNRLPKYTITGLKNANNADPADVSLIELSTNGVSAVSFAALLKAGITYQLTRRYCLVANIGFWDLKPTFKNVSVEMLEGNGFVIPGLYIPSAATMVVVNSNTFNYTQPMNSVDLSVGIAMRL